MTVFTGPGLEKERDEYVCRSSCSSNGAASRHGNTHALVVLGLIPVLNFFAAS